MKFNKIMFFFAIGLPISIILRIMQIIFTIDFESGFYFENIAAYGKGITVVIALVCVLAAFFAHQSYRSPEAPPKDNVWLSVSSVMLGLALIYEVFTEIFSSMTPLWQAAVIKLFGIVTAFYFIFFAVKGKIKFNISPLVHIIPAVYFILRTMLTFITISSLALISDNIFIMSAYCTSLLFFINFAKLYNNVGNERSFRKLLAMGLAATTLCLSQAVSYFAVNLLSAVKYTHTTFSVNLMLLFTGIFILVFLIRHFYVFETLYKRRFK